MPTACGREKCMRTKKQARIASGRIICMAAVATVSGVGAMTARGDTFTYTGGNYTQNFDRLQNTAQTYSFAATGPFNVPDDGGAGGAAALTGWQHSRVTGSATKFTIDDGNGFSGSTYSYGTVGSTERALGSLASGTSTPMFGAVMVNNSTSTYTGFTLSYTGEEWRRGTALANTLNFSYAVGGASIIDPGATFVSAAALNFTAPNTGGSSISLDGNAAGNRAAVNATV